MLQVVLMAQVTGFLSLTRETWTEFLDFQLLSGSGQATAGVWEDGAVDESSAHISQINFNSNNYFYHQKH